MNKRTTRTIIITLIIILLLLLLGYLLLMLKTPAKPVIKNPAVSTSTPAVNKGLPSSSVATNTPATPPQQVKTPPPSDDAITQTNLEKIARSFAERLGSYSNQSNFSNISDLEIQMTKSMQSWAESYIAANEKAVYSGVYQGVSTQAISDKVLDFDNNKGQADVLVQTQRVTQNGASSPVTIQQDITITFVKQNGVWLVDNAVWKK
jgi:hypothetical protein